MKYEPGRTEYPCTVVFSDGRCNGQTTLTDDHYQCQECGATWHLSGRPNTNGRRPSYAEA